MKFFIGNTDLDWYKYLKKLKPEDVNFWQPGGIAHFRSIEPGSPFLFKLKSPINMVAGIGFFTSHSILPIDFVWEVFQDRNGCESFSDFRTKIVNYRSDLNTIESNPNVGCIVLTNPIFFNEEDWIALPNNWSKNIVQGKTYSTSNEEDRNYWCLVEGIMHKYSNIHTIPENDQNVSLYNCYMTNVRIGQGAFRILVTDAYTRRCAISGEKTLPVLEAAHIKPYTFGINTTNNGLLLRADLHKLFDSGYITVTDKYIIEISNRIREEFENGKDYYKYHGTKLQIIPTNRSDMPDTEYLKWHNQNIFKT